MKYDLLNMTCMQGYYWNMTFDIRVIVQAAHKCHILYNLFNLKWEITYSSTEKDKGHVSSYNEQTLAFF